MSAPQFVPVDPVAKPRSYSSPDHVPGSWTPNRPAELDRGVQPQGDRQGYQGPDQGYGLVIAGRFKDKLQLQRGETAKDAIKGCLGIALRRASMYGRAPVVHDFTIAFTAWGFLDAHAPADLVELRKERFANISHHYTEGRDLADAIPEATLRMTPQQVASAYPGRWRELLGE